MSADDELIAGIVEFRDAWDTGERMTIEELEANVLGREPFRDGERVRLVDSKSRRVGLADDLQGREGVVEHRGKPDPNGCYVRFDNGSYAFAFYDEMRPIEAVT